MALHIDSLGNVLVAVALILWSGNTFGWWAVGASLIAIFALIGAIIWIIEAVYTHRTVFVRRDV